MKNIKLDSLFTSFSPLLLGVPCFYPNKEKFGTGALFNRFQPSVAFHIETSPLICTANQITVFYMKCSTGMKWVKMQRNTGISAFISCSVYSEPRQT